MITEWQIMLASNRHILVAFIIGMLLLGAAILYFRSSLLVVVQVLLLACLLWFGGNEAAGMIFSIIQYALFIFGLYRLKKAIDWSYTLTLEKIHKREPDITKNGNGSRSSFF